MKYPETVQVQNRMLQRSITVARPTLGSLVSDPGQQQIQAMMLSVRIDHAQRCSRLRSFGNFHRGVEAFQEKHAQKFIGSS